MNILIGYYRYQSSNIISVRPLVKLLGRGEVHLDGSLADIKLTRKIWFVLALLSVAPDAEMLRLELTESA